MIRTILLLGIFASLISCSKAEFNDSASSQNYSKEEIMDAQTVSSPMSHDYNGEDIPSNTNTERKLIKSADIKVEAENNKSYLDFIQRVEHVNGYISSSSQEEINGFMCVSIEAQIPSLAYENIIIGVKSGSDDITSFNQYTQDVTDQYIDLDARIKNKKSFENQYINLLKSAKNVSEILEIQREIESLRSDIESYESQFKYLSKQVAFSTIRISFEYPLEQEDNKGLSQNQIAGIIVFGVMSLMVIIFVFLNKRKKRKALS